jgi:peptidoglycan biosynthesis protein MviN/MurJ (putative lipid II flippase)
MPTSRKPRPQKYSAKEVLTLAVGVTLAITFSIIVLGVMYSLIFVTQPLGPDNTTGQALTDKMLIESILVPIVLFLSGALSGVLAANGLSNRKGSTPEPTQQFDPYDEQGYS